MKTIYDNDNQPTPKAVRDTAIWTLCAFALFCMIVGAVVMKIAIEGWG